MHDAKPLYKEVEGFSDSARHTRFIYSKVESKSYYWFEKENEVYVLYFDNTLEFHERPFLLFLIVPGADKKSWTGHDNCQLLTDAFDNFHKTSVFFSFLSNEQNKNFYDLSTNFLESNTFVEIELRETKTFMRTDFVLERFKDCASLLATVQVGTVFWNQYYKLGDNFFGLFVETYYLLYRETEETSETLTLFRNADLVELVFVSFQVSVLDGKFVVSDIGHSTAIIVKENITVYTRNKHTFVVLVPSPAKIDIVFDLKENKAKQFQLFRDDKKTYEYIGAPPVKKLLRVDQKVYLFENRFRRKISIEVPVYFFGKSLELSKLVIGFQLIQESFDGFSKVSTFFRIFSYKEKEKCTRVYFEGETYNVCFSYNIESGKFAFKLTRIRVLNTEELAFLEKETTETLKPTKFGLVKSFVDGLIIYNKDSFEVFSDSGHSKEKESTSIRKGALDTFNKRYTYMNVYLVISLVLLVVFVLIGRLFYQCRKKKHNNKRFKKSKKLNNYLSIKWS